MPISPAPERSRTSTGALECGYCACGFIVMATQLLDEHPEPTDNQIKHHLSGICAGMRRAPRSSMKLAAQKRKARGAH